MCKYFFCHVVKCPVFVNIAINCFSAGIVLTSLVEESARLAADNVTQLKEAASVKEARKIVETHCPGKEHS